MKFIEGNNRQQIQMICLDDYISNQNPVRFIDAFVDKIELAKIGITQTITCKQQKATTNLGGAPKHNPANMLKLYLYGYLNKIRSSRCLAQECNRNIELRWLMNEIVPNYHSIADFRKNNPNALKALFKLFVQFMNDNNLIGKQTIALDGSKFRAVNSKKNNYNQKKIDKHQQLIEDKTNAYLQQLDALDKLDNNNDAELQTQKIQQGLAALKERKLKYDTLQQQLDATEEKQISTTDAESSALIINKNIVEVAYNNQCVVDDKHNLIIHTQATNKNDAQALALHTQQAMQNIDVQKITVLADKGYHNGKQINSCHQQNIKTIVAVKEQPSVKHLDNKFLVENFIYNKAENTYTCPAGATLTTKGTWHNKKREAGETSYQFQKYTTTACATCALKQKCTQRKNREIERSEYQDAVDKNKATQQQEMHTYKRRQAIVEHPFGTIKRQWSFTYTLLKGLHKVDGELNLIMLCYNIKRVQQILGIEKLIANINNWVPNYSKATVTNQNDINGFIISKNKECKIIALRKADLAKAA